MITIPSPELLIKTLNPIGNHKTIAFISANPNEGITTVVLSFADFLFTNLSDKVLMVDANFQNPDLSNSLNHEKNISGLANLMGDSRTEIGELISSKESLFDFLSIGDSNKIAIKNLATERFKQVVNDLKIHYDYALFDLPPFNLFPLMSLVVPMFDGIVMVVECERTRWEVAMNLKDRIEAAGGNVLGVMLNKRRYYIPRWLYRFV